MRSRWYETVWSPEEIGDQYGQLNLAQVQAALAYYHANRHESKVEFADEERQYDRLAATYGVASEGSATVYWPTPNTQSRTCYLLP